MSVTSHRIAELLEKELAHLRGKEQAEQRAELIQKLATVRGELELAHQRYAELRDRVKAERRRHDEVQNVLNEVLAALIEHEAEKPAVYSYLPQDSECLAWRSRHDELTQSRSQLIQQRDAAIQTNPTDAVLYEGPNGILESLRRAERNLIAMLDGTIAQSPRGGVYGV
jgi:uncharacterized protein YhaN